ncbi:MAG: methylenetetrahydromethanopterin dehydrogenase [Thermoprotei archaeon]|nr:MAG: methylenetetrahydromethanopterin dehydrogenase [Thermoprotei archaeon]
MSEKGFKKIAIVLSTDEHPSPFDILFMYDIGVDAVLYYGNVNALNKAKSLILDAMFPRGPEGVKHTLLFIGGRNMDLVEQMFELAKKTMFEPFVMSVIADPAGAYTTAAALVAKVEHGLKTKFNMGIEGLKVVVVGGAGRVGTVACRLLAKEGANVVIADVLKDVARKRAEEINKMVGAERVRVAEEYPEKLAEICKDADIVLTTGPPGLQLVPKDVVKKAEKCKVLADVNAVPPLGIEGIKPSWDCKEYPEKPGTFVYGALAIGKLRNEVEKELIVRALIKGERGFYGYDEAFKIAKQLVGLA